LCLGWDAGRGVSVFFFFPSFFKWACFQSRTVQGSVKDVESFLNFATLIFFFCRLEGCRGLWRVWKAFLIFFSSKKLILYCRWEGMQGSVEECELFGAKRYQFSKVFLPLYTDFLS
jgi:hypothetical protein